MFRLHLTCVDERPAHYVSWMFWGSMFGEKKRAIYILGEGVENNELY